jgi:4-amino-4-deoxy-L-arabinose transferase-like glycosyltransferase
MPSLCATLARTRLTAWLCVLLVWTCLYVPHLGMSELQGNEPKRVLPALQMLRTGNWLTPELGGIKYLNKPPLIYWSVAGVFRATGMTDEGVARLPSVLWVLAFVSLLIWQRSQWLPLGARLCAALMFLTIVSFVEKGRQIEIEAAFVCVTGMALVWWLNAWAAGKTGWALWRGSCMMVALGLLLKGPLILLFFYVPVVCVAWTARRLRAVVTWQHGVAVVLMLLPLVAWVLAALAGNPDLNLARIWEGELGSRYAVRTLDVGGWIGGILKAFVDFLPWTLVLPLVWWPGARAHEDASTWHCARALRLAAVLCFVAVSSMPGVRSRYYMPLFPHLCCLVALTLTAWDGRRVVLQYWRALVMCACALIAGVSVLALALVPGSALVWLLGLCGVTLQPAVVRALHVWRWPLLDVVIALGICGGIYRARQRLVGAQDLAVACALLLCATGLGVLTYGVPCKLQFEDRRPAGAALNAIIEPDEEIVVYRVGYQPYYYYVQRPLAYVWQRATLTCAHTPIFTHAVFVPEITNHLALAPAAVTVTPLPYRREPYVLLRRHVSAPPAEVMPAP